MASRNTKILEKMSELTKIQSIRMSMWIQIILQLLNVHAQFIFFHHVIIMLLHYLHYKLRCTYTHKIPFYSVRSEPNVTSI